MLEARLQKADLLKKIVEAMKELVQDVNIDCTPGGLALQAMDSSHVSLCYLALNIEAFEHYRCDRNVSLGVSLESLSKILKCAGNDDSVTIKADQGTDIVNFMFENADQDRLSDFELKLMDIDSEQLGIPPTDYKATVTMPSNEFQRIIRDLGVLGDTCVISVAKDGVRFSVQGDMGTGNITVKPTAAAVDKKAGVSITMDEPVELNFAVRYLKTFTKATPLAANVSISLSPDVPLVVEYKMEQSGHIRYYLAPKIDDEDGEGEAVAA